MAKHMGITVYQVRQVWQGADRGALGRVQELPVVIRPFIDAHNATAPNCFVKAWDTHLSEITLLPQLLAFSHIFRGSPP